ncbi:carbohydrate-binding protein [Gluconacetobacter azotocaptans]|uniref:glycoside hydrolase family 66 protein n=1 Tax=Gluconacetobacter azotocaptans TaxID=142834 RepID=UPI0019574962|nr:glycoside hydrolase family 66 protein [Gluconacetobacter azotocaptans]MBM9401535.1 carbohydrate-binding protein [Gluconacetobacter azotocaptans]
MRKFILALIAAAFLPVSAGAASLSGPLITHVTDDKAFYKAGAPATVTIALTNGTGSAFTGNIDAMLCTSRGTAVGFQQMPVSGLAAGASTNVAWTLNLPLLNVHSFYLSIAALNSSDTGGVSCTGTGSTSSSPVDVASGAINVASSAWEDPIEAFVDAPTLSGASPTAQQVADNLAQYHVGLIQGYDLLSRHDAPYPTGSTWQNLAGITLTQSEVTAYASAFHGYGMKFLAYSLWNGAWSNYLTANPNVSLHMGMFTTACGASGGTCTLANQGNVGLGTGCAGWGWESCAIYYENPGNGLWMSWLGSQLSSVVTGLGFDGIHLDTLGDDGRTYYDAWGRQLPDIGGYMTDFANYVHARIGGICTDINQVMGWDLQDVAIRALVCNLYIEPHPEYGNYAFFPTLNGLVEQEKAWTPRQLITAYYPQQVMSGVLPTSDAVSGDSVTVCDPSIKGSAACPANNPGIELLLGQIAVSGASQLMLGDYDHLTPGPYFPRASLGIDANLQQYLADYYNWFVGMRDVMRNGVADAGSIVTITNGSGTTVNSSAGSAGTIYTRVWGRAGIAVGVSLTNLVGLSDNRIDDPDGLHNPAAQSSLNVSLGYYGNSTPGTLWYSAPDVNHGFPQSISYTKSGSTISFTLPVLKTTGLLVLEGGNLTTATDYTVGANDYIQGGTPNSWSNGAGVSGAAAYGCCRRWARWDAVDFGPSGVTTISAIVSSAAGGTIEFHADSLNGSLMATMTAPAGSQNLPITSPVSNTPTGTHAIYIVWSGLDVTVSGWQP